MEFSPRGETSHPNPNRNRSSLPSPNSSTSSNNVNGLQLQLQASTPTTPTAQPPKPVIRSDPTNPYPTTFVQADTKSFKQVVQMLTGSSETANKAAACSKYNIPPIKSAPKKQQHQQHNYSNSNNNNNNINSGFKLYERRKNQLRINPLTPVPLFNSGSNNHSGFSPRNPDVPSPSILGLSSLVLSPVTPLIPDPFGRSGSGQGCTQLNKEAEEKAIREKGFYLHPSPCTTPRESEPRLLPLFPTTSPRGSGSSSS